MFGGVSPRVLRAAAATLALALILGAGGCGRRGPPLAPLQVDPETPRVLPLRQENGAVVVRWYAPRLDSGGDPADLRLRRAIVSYRVLDLHALAAEERVSQRRPPEETEEEEPEAAPSRDEDAAGIPEPEDPATEEPAAADAPALETGEPSPEEEAPWRPESALAGGGSALAGGRARGRCRTGDGGPAARGGAPRRAARRRAAARNDGGPAARGGAPRRGARRRAAARNDGGTAPGRGGAPGGGG